MADPSDNPRPFDVRTVRYLVRLMTQNDLSEIDLAEGEQRIKIRRGPRVITASGPVALPPASLPAPAAASPAATAPSEPTSTAPAAATKKLIEIKSPTVGTFYAARDPNSPPFVQLGSKVTPSTVVCLIEAMKVFNDVQAECSGTIVEVCVKNKEFVEYNTVLFRVDPG
ncbi:MAG: acetyl-CoA carboxylase biotin carboxyl carrier protein [Gemmataceae bacterium]